MLYVMVIYNDPYIILNKYVHSFADKLHTMDIMSSKHHIMYHIIITI